MIVLLFLDFLNIMFVCAWCVGLLVDVVYLSEIAGLTCVDECEAVDCKSRFCSCCFYAENSVVN